MKKLRRGHYSNEIEFYFLKLLFELPFHGGNVRTPSITHWKAIIELFFAVSYG